MNPITIVVVLTTVTLLAVTRVVLKIDASAPRISAWMAEGGPALLPAVVAWPWVLVEGRCFRGLSLCRHQLRADGGNGLADLA
jgi:hypothetical protein